MRNCSKEFLQFKKDLATMSSEYSQIPEAVLERLQMDIDNASLKLEEHTFQTQSYSESPLDSLSSSHEETYGNVGEES
ncbi:unnamed protein product [Auanema sp. JU1783]|nr:unnamed protein product [Auanema sp. JU1783]